MSSYGENGARGKADIAEVMLAKPHVVLLTIPAPRHMLPSLVLAKALARRGVKVMFLRSVINNFETLRRDVEDEASSEELDISMGSILEDSIPEPENPMELKPWLSKLAPEYRADRAAQIMLNLSPPPCCLIVDAFLS